MTFTIMKGKSDSSNNYSCFCCDYISVLIQITNFPSSPFQMFHPDAYCSVSGTLHPQVLQFHSQCLSLCGDIQLMLAQNANNRAAYLEEYSYQTKEDQEILHSLHRESSCQGQSLRRDSHTNPTAHNGLLSA